MKICTVCKQTKELNEFYKQSKSLDGFSHACRACRIIQNKKWREQNIEVGRRHAKEFYIQNANEIKQRLLRKYKDNPDKFKEKTRIQYKKNRKKYLDYQKKRRLASPEKFKEDLRKWRKNNKEKIKETTKKWRKNNPGIVIAQHNLRRASKIRATPKWLTKEQLLEIKEIYILCKELQWLSEELLVVDHIIPLQGKTVCGFHHPDNLRIVPWSENARKANKLLTELL